MREMRYGVTTRVMDNIDDTRVQKLLNRYGIDPDQDEGEVKEALAALPEDEFNRLGEDFRRTTEADLMAEISLQIEDKAKLLWERQVRELDERSATLRNKTIPDALALYDKGDRPAFEEALKDIDAESVSITTDVHQQRLNVREELRRYALEVAPHLSRPERNQIVNEKASAEDLSNTSLYTPASAQQQMRAVADMKRNINKRDLEQDQDIDLRMAAALKASSDPRP